MNRSAGSDNVFESKDIESQNNNNGTGQTSLTSDDSRLEIAKLDTLADYVGCALPADVFSFLQVDYEAEKERRMNSSERIIDEKENENVNGGVNHLMRLAKTEQVRFGLFGQNETRFNFRVKTSKTMK